MASYNDGDGVWRTISGRRVFIRSGQSISSAMKASGKFKKAGKSKTKMQEMAVKGAPEKDLKEQYKQSLNEVSKMEYDGKINKDEYEKAVKNINDNYINKRNEYNGTDTKTGGSKNEFTREELKSKYGTDNTDVINAGKEKGDRVSLKSEETNTNEEKGFTQHTDMYGGTREYSKEQLDRMRENGVKPMEHSYTGGGWQGNEYDSKLSTKEIAKNITDYSKKEFPDVKLSRKTDYNGIDIHVMSSDKNLYLSNSDIDKMSDEKLSSTIRDSVGGYTRFDDWLNENNKKSERGTYTANEQREYLKDNLNNVYKDRNGDTVRGNEWYLSDYGKKVISGLNKKMNSYNYDDSDGMVDYFDTNFYGYVKIGKWDKPYEVKTTSGNGDWLRNAYNEYKKQHPNTKMSFNTFKKNNQ